MSPNNGSILFQLQEGGEACQVSLQAGIAVIDPFQLRLACSAPARSCALILAEHEVSQTSHCVPP